MLVNRRTKLQFQLARARKQRHRELSSDPKFVQGTDHLKRELESAYARHPQLVTDFFRQFSWPIAPKLEKMNAFLQDIQDSDPALRETLDRYIQHANRFRVSFVLRNRSPHYEMVVHDPGGSTFHVNIVNGHLTPRNHVDDDNSIESSFESEEVEFPASLDDDDSIDSSFESEEVEVPASLSEAIKGGRAKFIQIDDKEGSSCLSVLERVAYFPEGVTFVLHNAEQPYLFCLIGEKVSVDLWRRLSKTVTAILREKFDRGKAGRPKDLQKLKQAQELLEMPGSLKEKAAVLAGNAPNTATQLSYLSRLRKEQTK